MAYTFSVPHFNVNNLIDLVAAWGMAAVLWDLRRHDSRSPVTFPSRILFGTLFFFFALRAALLAWPSPLMDVLAYVPAALLPSAELLFAEGVTGRASPAWLRRGVFALSALFALLNLFGMRLGVAPVESAFTAFVLGTLAACALHMLARPRAQSSTLENRFIDAILIACALAVPLASTDFIDLGPESLHLGGLAALLLAYSLERVTGRSDRPGQLAGELGVLALQSGIIALVFQTALQDLSLHAFLRSLALGAAFMLLLTMIGHQRILSMRRREDSFLKWCLRLQTGDVNEFIEALKDFPLTRDHELVRLGELKGFDTGQVKARLSGERGMASLDQLRREDAAASAECARLLESFGMSHAFRIHDDLGLYLLFKGVEIGGDGYHRQKLELIQRMALSLEARDQVSRRDEALRQAQKLEALGRLSAGVSHEFGNLLMVIKGFGASIRRAAGLPASADEDAGEILKAAERASAITKQLLAFGRRQQLRRVRIDLAALLKSSQAMLAPLLPKQLSLELRLPASPLEVMADPVQMEQVLLNLVLNARDAMPEGGIIQISLEPGIGQARLTVKDDGQGMDEATLKRLFEPFFSTKPRGSGTGLGLATVHGIIEQSGGSINVKSEPGWGTEFTVLLPLAEEPNHD